MPDDDDETGTEILRAEYLIFSASTPTSWQISPCELSRVHESVSRADENIGVRDSQGHSVDWEYGGAPSAKGRFHLYPGYIDCECFSFALLFPAKEIELIQKCYEVLNVLRNIDAKNQRQISENVFFRLLYHKNEKENNFPLLRSFQDIIQYGPAKTWDSLEKHLHQLSRNYEELAKTLARPPLAGEEFTAKLIENQGTPYESDFYHSLAKGSYALTTPVHICAADGLLSRMLPRNGWTKNPKNEWIKKSS